MAKAPTITSSKDLLGVLATARDSARLRLHLLSLDARAEWNRLEKRFDETQRSIEAQGEKVSESAVELVRELRQAVETLVRDSQRCAALQRPAQQLMKPAKSCGPRDKLSVPARLMWELDFGAVPVVDDGGRVIGMVTDRDIAMASYRRKRPLFTISVASTMSQRVTTASPGDSIETILRLMRQRQVRRVPIVEAGRLVGIISLADIAQYLDVTAPMHPVATREVTDTLAAIVQPRRQNSHNAAA